MRKFEGKYIGKLAGEENQQEKQWELNWGSDLKSVGTPHKWGTKVSKTKKCLYCGNGCVQVGQWENQKEGIENEHGVTEVYDRQVAWYKCQVCNERQLRPFNE